jgi:hypothetical protein
MKAMAVLLVIFGLQVVAQDMKDCPMHKDHQPDVQKHGDKAMGFPHDQTTHHFRLYPDGGAIEVTANDSKDDANIEAIRSHLTHIAQSFGEGDFSLPMFIHCQVPPGVEVMKKERSEISYSFEEIAAGGRVRIKTKSEDTLKAVHEFLCFQIEDHRTGDSTDVTRPIDRSGLRHSGYFPTTLERATLTTHSDAQFV